METTRIDTETPWPGSQDFGTWRSIGDIEVLDKDTRKYVFECIGQSTICDAEVRFCLTVVRTDDGRVVWFFQHPGVIFYVSPILLYDY